MKKVLITGANFNNKGAQSMLFVCIDEIRRRFPDAKILFQTKEIIDESNYHFEIVWIGLDDFKIANGCISKSLSRIAKDCVKLVLGRKQGFLRVFRDIGKIKDVDLVIDISGFSIGEKWEKSHNEGYINKIKFAKKYNVPFYMLPQSIGPFHFEKNMSFEQAEKLRRDYAIYLKYPKIIYARERDGERCLAQLGITENVKRSSDLVLQNNGIDPSNIFKKTPVNQAADEEILTGSVALVPNFQIIRHGSEKTAFAVYQRVIEQLLKNQRDVYIIRHSNDDKELCDKLYSSIASDKLHLINKDLSCLEYDSLIRKFDYVIGSRFHGIVHALRNGVPCIALGWAIKYQELLDSVGQRKYVFDATNENKIDEIIAAIDDMEAKMDENKSIVRKHLEEIRKNNCFSFLDDSRWK